MSDLTKEEVMKMAEQDAKAIASEYAASELRRALATIDALEAERDAAEKERHEVTVAMLDASSELRRGGILSLLVCPEIKTDAVELARCAANKIIALEAERDALEKERDAAREKNAAYIHIARQTDIYLHGHITRTDLVGWMKAGGWRWKGDRTYDAHMIKGDHSVHVGGAGLAPHAIYDVAEAESTHLRKIVVDIIISGDSE